MLLKRIGYFNKFSFLGGITQCCRPSMSNKGHEVHKPACRQTGISQRTQWLYTVGNLYQSTGSLFITSLLDTDAMAKHNELNIVSFVKSLSTDRQVCGLCDQ